MPKYPNMLFHDHSSILCLNVMIYRLLILRAFGLRALQMYYRQLQGSLFPGLFSACSSTKPKSPSPAGRFPPGCRLVGNGMHPDSSHGAPHSRLDHCFPNRPRQGCFRALRQSHHHAVPRKLYPGQSDERSCSRPETRHLHPLLQIDRPQKDKNPVCHRADDCLPDSVDQQHRYHGNDVSDMPWYAQRLHR